MSNNYYSRYRRVPNTTQNIPNTLNQNNILSRYTSGNSNSKIFGGRTMSSGYNNNPNNGMEAKTEKGKNNLLRYNNQGKYFPKYGRETGSNAATIIPNMENESKKERGKSSLTQDKNIYRGNRGYPVNSFNLINYLKTTKINEDIENESKEEKENNNLAKGNYKMADQGLKGFIFEKEIGKGAFSKVILAKKKDSGERFAIKQIDKSFINDPRYKKYLNNEVFILNNIKDPNIISFYGTKMDMNYIYLIFEYCNGGDLQHCLDKYLKIHDKPFPQNIVQYIMRKIISGFVYLHSRKILHRDIKLDNMLVKFKSEEDMENLNMLNAEIKITDFGFARYLKAENLATSLLGNPINMDPHILRKMARIDHDTEFGYDEKADIWSLGTITYELLVGYPAFEANSYEELITKIESGNYKIPHEIILSKEAISFLNGMMRYDPKSRLSVFDLSKQYFLTRDTSTFHNIQLKKSNIDLAQSIVINSKDEKNANNNLWDFYNANYNLEECDPQYTVDDKPFVQPGRGNRIKEEEPPDYIGKELEKQKIDDAYKKNEESNVDNKKENLNPSMSNYLHNIFDEMNKDCFYIEPLLIPTQPSDSYNSVDPISRFMENL